MALSDFLQTSTEDTLEDSTLGSLTGGAHTAKKLLGFSNAGEDSDQFDILGLGLDAERDIKGILGLEAQEAIADALGDVNQLIGEGIRLIGVTAQEAKIGLQDGTLNAIDLIGKGLESSQGFISQGQNAALQQLGQGFSQAATALGGAKSAIFQGGQQAVAGLDPFAKAGVQGLQDFQQGSTAQGFGQNIADLQSSGALNPLIAARTNALQSAQGAAGLSRSGAGLSELAAIPQDVLLGIEGLLSGRQQSLAGQGLGAQGQIAGLQAGTGQQLAGVQGNMANLLAQQGQLGAGIQSGGGQLMANLASGAAQTAGGFSQGLGQGLAGVSVGQGENIASLLGAQAQAQLEAAVATGEARATGLGNVADIGGSVIGAFSDERLKQNIIKVGALKIRDMMINVYSYEPNELGRKLGMVMNTGVMAQELKKLMPDLVGERQGYLTVNYDELLKRAI